MKPFSLRNNTVWPASKLSSTGIKANIFKERGDDFNYEIYIKDAIEKAESIGFQLLVKDMAKELGDYYYNNRFYKKAARYYALALINT